MRTSRTMFPIVVLSVSVIIVPAAGAAHASIIYVDRSATGPTPDGATWCTAYVDLQNALAVATAGDEIRIANGTYKPDRGTRSRTATFRLINGVALRGGYAGCGAPDPNLRNFTAYESILSGDLDGND